MKSQVITIVLAAPILWIGASGAAAATLTVPGDHGTIQACIDAAVSGQDECVVAPGTYVESINFNGKAITLRGSGGPEVTTIDGNGAFHVVWFVGGEGPDSVLDGFTITGGSAIGTVPDERGAGFFIDNSGPTISNCTITGNIAAEMGGGLANFGGHPVIRDCRFEGNSADDGGGIYHASGNIEVVNSRFIQNSARNGAGATMSSTGSLINSAFIGNVAEETGSAIRMIGASPVITNCTFSGNTSGPEGGAIRVQGGAHPTITNSILWGNGIRQVSNEIFASNDPTFRFCIVQGGIGSGSIDGGGNLYLNADPLFLDADGADGVLGTEDDDLRLGPCSPATDGADNAAIPGSVTLDIDGNSRYFDDAGAANHGAGAPPLADMGAFERHDVTAHADIENVSQGTMHCSIQDAIRGAASGGAVAGAGDEIVVPPGVYSEAIDFMGKAITVRSSGGAGVTTIAGDGTSPVVLCISGEGPSTVIQGFTITGPAEAGLYNLSSSPTVVECNFTGSLDHGMHNVDGSSPTVAACTFTGITSDTLGAGMYNSNSHPTVTDCTFGGNVSASIGGAGMFNSLSNPVVRRCSFVANRAITNHGGGMYNSHSSPLLIDSIFLGNRAMNRGGGLYNIRSSPTVVNSVFSGNHGYDGGAICNEWLSHSILTNCTISGNEAVRGGGKFNIGDSDPVVTNTIIWGNVSNLLGDSSEIFNYDPQVDNPVFRYSNVRGGLPPGSTNGIGNIDADPLFVDADGLDDEPGTEDDDLRLQDESPCIDAGINTAAGLSGVLTDADGADRFRDVASVADTGWQYAPIVDMGAYENQSGIVNTCDGGSNDGGSCFSDADCPGGACGLKNRYLTVSLPLSAARGGLLTDISIQVTIIDIDDALGQDAREGEVWWAGSSQSLPNAPNADLTGAPLVCEDMPSHAQAWPTGVVQLFGAAIVPGSIYEVRTCDPSGANCSEAFIMGTGKWGDVVSPMGGGSQPNFGDISSLVDKFKELVNAPEITRTDLVPDLPNHVTNFADISAGVDAFKGSGYPGAIPACP